MKTFIRAGETWVPDADGYLLEFGGGVYDNAPAFGAASRSMCFGRGEGLPGRVWEEGQPIILKDLQGGYFQRAAAAKLAGLTAAIAFPLFLADRMTAVVVLFCGDVQGHSGAIEVWRNDPALDADLRLVDGLYGAQDAALETVSRQTGFARGAGLPGAAWQRRASVFMDGLSSATRFVRAAEAGATGLARGLAIPCPVPGNDSCVLTFLSAPSLPIAARIESWVPGREPQTMQRAHGFDEASGALATEDHRASDVDPAIRKTFEGGVPQSGTRLLTLPIVSEGKVVEAIAMHF